MGATDAIVADGHEHGPIVAAWMRDAAEDARPAQLVALFEGASAAMWKRAQVTLGEVTLAAIVDRVLYTAAARFPALDALTVDPGGVHFDELKARTDSLDEDALREAVQFAMVEFLTVIGHLTAEILTPALHSVLSSVALDDPARPEPDGPPQPDAAGKKQVRQS